MDWIGKRESYIIANTPCTSSLSLKRFDASEIDSEDEEFADVIIECDNLMAMKMMIKPYSSKIKVIFIDPPYNTGKEFIYSDDYQETRETFLEKLHDDEGNVEKEDKNDKSASKHTKWLNMMNSRLLISKQLLRPDGVMFVTISDDEHPRLRLMLDEIFGEENFIANIVWNSTKSVTNTALISVGHTHILCYAKNKDYFTSNKSDFRLPDSDEGFTNPDDDPRGKWKADPFQVEGERPNQLYEIKNPNTGKIYTPSPGNSWKNDKKTFEKLNSKYHPKLNPEGDRIVFGTTGEAGPQRKRFLVDALEKGRVAKTWWDDLPTTSNGTKELQQLFDGDRVFTNPKPIGLMERILDLAISSPHNSEDAIILDFFGGSGTTGHAAIKLNSQDGGKRRFIIIQLPEALDEESKKKIQKNEFATIADVTFERLTRARESCNEKSNQLRQFSFTNSSFKRWQPEADNIVKIEDYVEGFRSTLVNGDVDSENILWEIAISLGVSLGANMQQVELGEISVSYDPLTKVMIVPCIVDCESLLDTIEDIGYEVFTLGILEDSFGSEDNLKLNFKKWAEARNINVVLF